jgi:hypothetical protein
MAEPVRVEPGELTADELIELLDSGRRVIVEVDVLGSPHEVTLRQRSGTYYCDTPTTLHTHETESGIRDCLEGQGYARPERGSG